MPTADTDLPSPGRRAFLRGHARPVPALRPPWAGAEPAFLAACTGCDACVKACPQQVLVRADGGYPVFDPKLGECTFCGECADACRTGALERSGAAPWTLIATLGASCLAARGVVCSSCRDACGESAISFPLARVAVPRIDPDRCTGCGACVGICPSSALGLHHGREREPA